jgi:PmbA protein
MKVEGAKHWLLARATERGVDLEVLATTERKLEIEAEDGRTSDLTHATQGGVGLRVVANGRTGYASSEELSEAALGWALDEAIENAGLQESAGAALPAGAALGRHDLIGEGLSAGIDAKGAAVAAFERGVRTDPRVQSMQVARYFEEEHEVALGSTRGADGGYRNGFVGLMGIAVLRAGDSVKQGWDLSLGKEFHALEPGTTAQSMLHKVGRHLGARPLKTGRRRATLEPDVVATLLGLFAYAVSGKSLAEGKSRLGDRLGDRIASDLVTIVDDATRPDGLGSRPFDAEGTPARRVVVVERGVLRSFLHNSDTARRTGQATTGHAARTYASTLGVAPTNLVLEAGTGVPAGDGVVVTDLMGVHAGANPITGDVSVQAMGIEVVGGERVPVDDFAISFNLFEFLERIDAVGDDTQWFPKGAMIAAPSVAVDGLSFAGA